MELPKIYNAAVPRVYNASSSTSARTSEKPSEPSGTDSILEKLRQLYPELKLQVADIADQEAAKNAALSSNGMYNVIIDSSLLQQMAADESVYKKYEAIFANIAQKHDTLRLQKELTGRNVLSVATVIDANGKVSNCVASQSPKTEAPPLVTDTHAKNSNLEKYQSGKSKNPYTINYKFNYGGHMTRLAQAKSIQNVRGLIQVQYGELGKAKRLIEDKGEAAVTVRRIRSVISKASLKISRLRKEDELDLQRAAAEKKAKEALAREMGEKLRAKRIARTGQERCDTVDQLGLLQSANPASVRYDEIYKAYQANAQTLFNAAASGMGVGAGPATGSAAGADLGSGAVSVDISVDVSV